EKRARLFSALDSDERLIDEGYRLTEDIADPGVRVARIGKPHGIRGEVTVEVFTDSPDTRFTKGNVFNVRGGESTSTAFEQLTLDKARWNKNILLLNFDEFSDRNTAESLRNCELYAEPEAPVDDEDGWYADDLIGLTVHQDTLDTPSLG